MTKNSLVEQYFSSQKELGIPSDFILDEKFVFPKITPKNHFTHTQNTNIIKSEPVKIKESVRTAEKTEVSLAAVDAREELAKLFYKCRTCNACSLSSTRKNFVFGAGTAYTDVIVVGEAPGADEDEQGKPFVGAAGMLLTKMLAAIHLERDKIFIANILKCRPPQNRKPNPSEIATCFPLLKRQIDIIKPKAILLLGATAANSVLKNEKSVGSLRGIVHYYENIPVIVSYHPSALLRDATYKRPAWDDLQKFERLLKELRNG